MPDQGLSPGLQAFCRIYEADSPESAMRTACASLLASCGLQEPPIPLKPIIQKLGIELKRLSGKRRQRDQQPEAVLAARRGGLVAYIYEDDRGRNWRRARFSLAHETGHAILIHSLGDTALIASLEESPEEYRTIERLCDFAASELLMPARAVRKAIKQFGLGPSGLASIYDRFLVSREALLRRLAVIVPHASVLKWRPYARSEQEPTAMRVVRSFPGYSRDSTRPWLPAGCTTRHLNPPIVDWAAARNEVIEESDLRITLRGKSQSCVGLATFFPTFRKQDQQPFFEGYRIPDEQSRTPEILLFAVDKAMGGGTAWGTKKI